MPSEINGFQILPGQPRPWMMTAQDRYGNLYRFEVHVAGQDVTDQHDLISVIRDAGRYGLEWISGVPQRRDAAYEAVDQWILNELRTVPAGPRTAQKQAAEYDVDPSGTVEGIRPDRQQRPTHVPPTAHSVRTFGALPTGTEFSWQSRKWRKMTDTKAKEITGQPGRPKLVTMNPTEVVL